MSAQKPNKWMVALSVTFGTLMGAIDASIVNVALSQIRGAVGATVQEITWISTGFAIATVMVMPLTGFFGRLFGLDAAERLKRLPDLGRLHMP